MITIGEFITKKGVTMEFCGDYDPYLRCFSEYHIFHNNDAIHEVMDDAILLEIEKEMEELALSELTNTRRFL